MKKIILLIKLSAFLGSFSNAQNDKVQLKDLKVPVAPAFSILDFSPKTIESPGTIKAFTTNLVTNAALTAGIPKNFAFEFAPFWFFKHPNMSIYQYYGLGAVKLINDSAGSETFAFVPKKNIFYGLRSTSLSFGSVFKDSGKTMPVDVNYIGYAMRSNIINIRIVRIDEGLKTSIEDVNEALQNIHLSAISKCNGLPENERLDCIGNFITHSKDSILKSTRSRFESYANARSRFSVDLALASSTAFGNNSFGNSKSYRTGGWITLAYYQPLVSAVKVRDDIKNLLECKNYFNAYFLFRTLSENKSLDFRSFTKQNLIDYGGRAELEFDRFSFSLESIKRINKDIKSLNTSRTVGIIQYKVNDNLFLLGTFGKDFGSINNLTSLLGINWGFGENALNKSFN